jgi:hypothetical protein
MGLLSLPGGGAGSLSRLLPGGFPVIRVNPSWIINLPLAPTARWVLVCMNDYGWPCWPSIPTLAKKTGVPRRSLQRVLEMLRKGGVLKSSGNGKSLTWELLEVPPEVERKVIVEQRQRGADRRRGGASGAPRWRTTSATVARGSEPVHEPAHLNGVRPLDERRATPVEADPEGTEYQSLAAALRARRQGGEAPEASGDPLSILDALRAAHGAGVPPPAGGGLAAGGSDTQRAQARREALRGGRMYA